MDNCILEKKQKKNSDSIWITWENQRRNRELSSYLNIELFELKEIDKIRNRIKKYLLGLIKTIIICVQTKPKIIVCQNPSLVLSLFLVIIKPIFNISLAIDAHNAGLFPLEGKCAFLNRTSQFIHRRADLTIVTNEPLKLYVEKIGGRGFVLPDRIPKLINKNKFKLKGRINFLFISSFSKDEPYELVFETVKDINTDIFIYVTGNFSKTKVNFSDLPENLILTGFLKNSEYIDMLYSVDAIIDLTTRENCLVCGAYESLAVEKPMILSNKKMLREYFKSSALYTEHTNESLKNAIYSLIEIKSELIRHARKVKDLRTKEWDKKKEKLQIIFESWKLKNRA
jgi:hypothetical protein